LNMMDVEFDVALDTDSLTEVGNEVPTPKPETEETPEPETEETPEETPDISNKNELEKGVYSIQNRVLQSDKDEESMAAQYTNASSQLDVTDSGMYLTL
ncbi:MAG TPA: hypothetical protein DCY20_07475, partial [Firmicutes bacterium]|nr:hypothetical protein [Bacillota bacterium]